MLSALFVVLTSAEPTSTTAASASPAAIATATAAAKASHLSKTGVNLLLSLLKNINKLTGLLLICLLC